MGGGYDGNGSAAAMNAAAVTREHRDLLRFMYQVTAKGGGKSYHQWSEEWKGAMTRSRTVHANACEGEWEHRSGKNNTTEWRWVPKDEKRLDWQQWSWGSSSAASAPVETSGASGPDKDWDWWHHGWDGTEWGASGEPAYVQTHGGVSEQQWAEGEQWAIELDEAQESMDAARAKAKPPNKIGEGMAYE